MVISMREMAPCSSWRNSPNMGFSLLNLQCPPRFSARLSSSVFPTSHPFIRSLPILNGMMGYDYIKKKVYLQSDLPFFLFKNTLFLRGADNAGCQELAFQYLKWPSWEIGPLHTKILRWIEVWGSHKEYNYVRESDIP